MYEQRARLDLYNKLHISGRIIAQKAFAQFIQSSATSSSSGWIKRYWFVAVRRIAPYRPTTVHVLAPACTGWTHRNGLRRAGRTEGRLKPRKSLTIAG